MKKCIVALTLVMALVISVAYADFMMANSMTIGWEAVTVLENGNAVPADDVISYNVYIVEATEDGVKLNPVLMGNTEDTTFLITLTEEGQYWVGLTTLRNGAETEEVAWSDNPVCVQNGSIFGIMFFYPAELPAGMYIVR